jgi:hypothetical protein
MDNTNTSSNNRPILRVWLPLGYQMPYKDYCNMVDGLSQGMTRFDRDGVSFRVLYHVPGDVLYIKCGGRIDKTIAFSCY